MLTEETKSYKNAISGVLVVDKPIGMTSHDVVAIVRKGTGIRRIGHIGTLDPRASGVLVLLVGPAVRLSEYLVTDTKRYEALITFGATSNTYDADGEVQETGIVVNLDEETVLAAMERFTGTIVQRPPNYSALKIKGKKAYQLARAGVEFEIPEREVTVFDFELVEFNPPDIAVEVYCSSGTYIRSLAHDLGAALGCGGYLRELRRTKSGKFSLRQAVPLDDLKFSFEEGDWYQYLIPAIDALGEFPEVVLEEEDEMAIRCGKRIAMGDVAPNADGLAKGVSVQGELVAILVADSETNEWQPKKVFLAD